MTLEATVGRVRIDKQHRDAYQAQREVAKAVRTATENAGLERTLVELVNIRVSQINGCAYCLHVHVRDALLGGETTQRLAVLPAWRETTLFTAKERAALTLAESLTTLPDPRAQEQDYADAADVLTEEELSAISWVTIAMNSFNRLSIVSRHPIRTGPPPTTERNLEEAVNVAITVRDNPTEHRYEIHDGDQLAGFTAYKLTGDEIAFIDTEIDPAFARRGLAKVLVSRELDDAHRRGLAVLPFCPCVRRVIAQNAETYLHLVPTKDRARFDLPAS